MPGASDSGSGSGSGGGMGYNIPISVSQARSTDIPQSEQASTYFIFSSPDTEIGATSNQANPTNPTTATSSAALGGNATSSAPGAGAVGTTATQSNLILYIALGLSAIGAIVGVIALIKHK